MAWTALLLSDLHKDIRSLLRMWPVAPYNVVQVPLKTTAPENLISIHPDLLLVDASGDVETAEEVTKTLSLAWEIGLPPIIVVVDEDAVARFRFESGADDFILTTASSSEISARLNFAARRSGKTDEATVLKVGDVTVNPENYQVYVRE